MARFLTEGSSQNLEIGNAFGISAAPVTMSCMFRTSNASGTRTLVWIGDSTATNVYLRLMSFSGGVRAQARDGGGAKSATTTTTYSVNTWTRATLVITAAGSLLAYLDGGGEGTAAGASLPSTINKTAIGVHAVSTPTDYWDEEIAEVEIINKELTAAEIAVRWPAGTVPALSQMAYGDASCYVPMGGVTANDADKELITGVTFTAINTPTTADHPPGVIYRPDPWRYKFFEPPAASTVPVLDEGMLVGGFAELAGGLA